MAKCIFIDDDHLKRLGLYDYDTKFAEGIVTAVCSQLGVDNSYWYYEPIVSLVNSVVAKSTKDGEIINGNLKKEISKLKPLSGIEYFDYMKFVFNQNVRKIENNDGSHKYIVSNNNGISDVISTMSGYVPSSNKGKTSNEKPLLTGKTVDAILRNVLPSERIVVVQNNKLNDQIEQAKRIIKNAESFGDKETADIFRRDLNRLLKEREQPGTRVISGTSWGGNETTVETKDGEEFKIKISEDVKTAISYLKSDIEKNGGRIVTDEIPLALKVDGKLIAGCPDMIIVWDKDESGKPLKNGKVRIQVVDFKCLSNGLNERNTDKYYAQLQLYNKAFTANFGNVVTSTPMLLQLNVYYDDNGDANVYSVQHNERSRSKSYRDYLTPVKPLNTSGTNINLDFSMSSGRFSKAITESESDIDERVTTFVEKLFDEYEKRSVGTVEEEPVVIRQNNTSDIIANGKLSYSDIINVAETTVRQLASELLDLSNTDDRFLGMSPAEIAHADPEFVNKIIEEYKAPYYITMDDVSMFIYENFEKILQYANSSFIRLCGLKVNMDGNVDFYEDEVDSDSPLTIEGKEESSKESDLFDWKDPSYEEMDGRLKCFLSTLRDYEKEESEEFRDDIVLESFVNESVVIYTLMENLHSCETYSEMEKKMATMQDKYPWVSDIMLNIELAGLQSQFFTTMRRSACRFTKVLNDGNKYDGDKYNPINLEVSNKAESIMSSVMNKFIRPGKNEGLLFYRDSEDPIGTVRVNEDALNEIEILNINNGKINHTVKNREITKNNIRLLGFSEIEHDDVFGNRKSSGLHQGINEAISTLYGYVSDALKSNGNDFNKPIMLGVPYGNSRRSINDAYLALARTLSPLYIYKAESSIFDGETNHPSFADVSYYKKTIDRVASWSADRIKAYYNNDSYMISDGDKSELFNPILRAIAYEGKDEVRDEIQGTLGYCSDTMIDDESYMDQTDKQFLVGNIMNYIAPRKKFYDKKIVNGKICTVGRFKMPIFSDKNENAYFEFMISKDRLFGGNSDSAKTVLTEDALLFAKSEVERIAYVFSNAVNNRNTTIDNFDFKDSSIASKAGKLEVKDVFDKNGSKWRMKDAFLKSAASFKMFGDFNGYVANDKKMREWFVDVLNSVSNKSEVSYSSFSNKFKEYFRGYMDGLCEQTRERLEKTGGLEILTNSIDSNQYDSTININSLIDEYVWNSYIMSMSIINLTVVDQAYFKNIVDFQKRFAQVYSQTRKADTECVARVAKYNADGSIENITDVNLSDGKHRTIIIEDDEYSSKLSKSVGDMFDRIISSTSDKNVRSQYERIKESAVSLLEDKTKIADGQGYGSPTGFWKKCEMLGRSDRNFNSAMERIRRGERNIADIDCVIQSFKPFVFSHIDVDGRKVPMQVKDSETMIMLAGVISDQPGIVALHNVLENSHYGFRRIKENGSGHELSNYNMRGIDAAVMHSAVKNGANNVVKMPVYTDEMRSAKAEELKGKGLSGKKLNDAIVKAETEWIYNKLIGQICNITADGSFDGYKDSVIEMPFDDWGEQQLNPAHMRDHEQSMGSQIRVLDVADMEDDVVVTESVAQNPVVEKHFSNKKRITADEWRKKYFELIDKDMKFGMNELVKKFMLNKDFSINGTNRIDFNRKISEICKNTVKNDQKFTIELYNSFDLDEYGEFKIPIGDPELSNEMFKVIFSAIKKEVNYEYTAGGPVVQEAPFGGYSDQLNVLDSKGRKYGDEGFDVSEGVVYEIYTVAPTSEIEDKIVYKRSRSYKNGLKGRYKSGEILSMDDIMRNELLTDDELKCICYRIPTEDTYSMFRCNIKGFLPRQKGETIIMPFEVPVLSGTDFDIDKMYCMFKYDTKNLSDGSRERVDVKNDVFDMQWVSLGLPTQVEKHFNPGNFDELKVLASMLKNAGSVDDINSILTQLELRSRNRAGKKFVGIAASNNIAHSILNMAKIRFVAPELFTRHGDGSMKINGIPLSVLVNDGTIQSDPTRSAFTGGRISRTVGMFVGAAADNAKEALLGVININPTTANTAMAMIRMGIPLDFIVASLNTPIIKECFNEAEDSGKRFEYVIEEKYAELFDGSMLKSSGVDPTKTMDINVSELFKVCNGESKNANMEYAVLSLLNTIAPYTKAYQQANIITGMNSTKNSVGPNQYEAMIDEIKINDFIDNPNELFNIDQTDGMTPVEKIFETVPYLKTICSTFTDVVPSVGRYISPMYDDRAYGFKDIIEKFLGGTYLDDSKIKNLYNDYMLFKLAKTIGLSRQHLSDVVNVYPMRIMNEIERIVPTTNTFAGNINVKISDSTPILTINSAMNDVRMRNEMIASWDAITRALSSDPKTLEDGLELSKMIFEYALLTRGAEWSMSSIMNMAPNSTKQFDLYINMFDEKQRLDDNDFKSFVIMNIRNRGKNSPFVSRVRGKLETENGELVLNKDSNADAYDTISRTGMYGISNGKNVYVLTDVIDDGVEYHFKKVNTLGTRDNVEYFNTENPIDDKSVYGDNGSINIYAGTNENADLSNFAIRPFTIDLSPLLDDITGYSVGEQSFQSVEQAFQAIKVLYFSDPISNQSIANKILNTTNGTSLRSLGKRHLDGFDANLWDANSSKIMKALIKASFEQNPQAAQRLLDTGDATLTHTQDKSKWKNEFPKLLMEVRSELRDEMTDGQVADDESGQYDEPDGGHDDSWYEAKAREVKEFRQYMSDEDVASMIQVSKEEYEKIIEKMC